MDPLDVVKGTTAVLLGQIPALGPILSGVFRARAKELLEQRFQEFLEELRVEAESFVGVDLPKQYLESQDFLHLVLLAFDHAQRTRQREKRRLYARALLNAGTQEWMSRCDLAEELLNALAELSPTEIRVLQVARRCSAPIPGEDHAGLVPSRPFSAGEVAVEMPDLGLTAKEVGAYLLRLQRVGLTEVAVVTAGDGPGLFRLTPLLERLMELIQAPS